MTITPGACHHFAARERLPILTDSLGNRPVSIHVLSVRKCGDMDFGLIVYKANTGAVSARRALRRLFSTLLLKILS